MEDRERRMRRGSDCSSQSGIPGNETDKEKSSYCTGAKTTLSPVLAAPMRRKSEGDLDFDSSLSKGATSAPCAERNTRAAGISEGNHQTYGCTVGN